jgi:hypothetical protein
VAKFPTPEALARGEFPGLVAEATSEKTFSFSERLFSKLRAMAVGAACPWPVSDAEIMAEYECRRAKRNNATAAAASAAAAAAAAAPPPMASKSAAFSRLARAHSAQVTGRLA